jgi:hypothetical protein
MDELEVIMSHVFDQSHEVHGTVLGGQGKYAMYTGSAYLGHYFSFTDNPALTEWVGSAIKAIKQWVEYAEEQLHQNRDESFDPSIGLSEEYDL